MPNNDIKQLTDPSFWEESNDSQLTNPSFWNEEPEKEAPKKQEFMVPEIPTAINAIAKANYAKKPETKIKIFAKSRGIPESSYKIIDNEIVFEKDGKLYKEAARPVRRILTEAITDPVALGALGLGTIATAGGLAPLTAAAAGVAGGMLGEFERQQLASREFGEQLTPYEKAEELGTAGLISTIGEGAGYILTKGGELTKWGFNKLKELIGTGGQYTSRSIAALKSLGLTDKQTIKVIEKAQKNAKDKWGIKLNLIEAAEGAQKGMSLKKLAMEEPAEAIQRSTDIENAIPDFIKKLFPNWESTLFQGPTGNVSTTKEFSELAQQRIGVINENIRKIVEPFYEAALKKDTPKQNINELIDKIKILSNEYLRKEKNKILSLTKEIPSKKIKKEPREGFAARLFEPEGPPTEIVQEANLYDLDLFKKAIDKRIVKNPQTSIEKSMNIAYFKIKDIITGYMDSISSEYQIARAVHALLNYGKSMMGFAEKTHLPKNQIESLANAGEVYLYEKNVLENIAKIDPTKIQNIGSYILSSNQRTPGIVGTIRNAILSFENGEKLWEKSFGDYIEFEAQRILQKASINERIDFGAQLWKSLFGNKYKESIMKNALSPEQFNNFYNLMDTLRKTGIVFGKTVKQQPLEVPGHEILKKIGATSKPLMGTRAVAVNTFIDRLTKKDFQSLLKIINNPNAAAELKKINNIKDDNIKLNMLMRLIGWTGYEIERKSSND